MTISTQTRNKSCRISWGNGEKRVSIDFYTKSAIKSQVVVQHQKISSRLKADDLKLFWKEKLQVLEEIALV